MSLRLAQAAELGGSAAQTVSEAQLEARLYTSRPRVPAVPGSSQIHTDLQPSSVTLQLL